MALESTAFPQAEPEKALQGVDRPGDGTGRKPPLSKLGDQPRQVGLLHPPGIESPAPAEQLQTSEVPAVGLDCVLGKPPLGPQMSQVLGDRVRRRPDGGPTSPRGTRP